jgi:ribosomal protein S27AE
MTKVCSSCKQRKDAAEFYKCHSHRDGLATSCKTCSSAYQKGWAKRHVEYLRAAKKADRVKNRERYNALTRERRRKDSGSRKLETIKRAKQHGQELVEYCRRYRKENPEKYRAHSVVTSAIRSGILIKPKRCEMCGSTHSLRAHHDNYDEPLYVRWLCARCHAEVHQKEVNHDAVV